MTNPTDEEIMDLMPQQMRDDLANAARALAGFDRAPRHGCRRHAHHPQPPRRRPTPALLSLSGGTNDR
jgi:hypothetical protein